MNKDVLKFDAITVNHLTVYNEDTGEFVCPLEGLYVIGCLLFTPKEGWPWTIHYTLARNGNDYAIGAVTADLWLFSSIKIHSIRFDSFRISPKNCSKNRKSPDKKGIIKIFKGLCKAALLQIFNKLRG